TTTPANGLFGSGSPRKAAWGAESWPLFPAVWGSAFFRRGSTPKETVSAVYRSAPNFRGSSDCTSSKLSGTTSHSTTSCHRSVCTESQHRIHQPAGVFDYFLEPRPAAPFV